MLTYNYFVIALVVNMVVMVVDKQSQWNELGQPPESLSGYGTVYE